MSSYKPNISLEPLEFINLRVDLLFLFFFFGIVRIIRIICIIRIVSIISVMIRIVWGRTLGFYVNKYV